MKVAHTETVARVGHQRVPLLPGQAIIGRNVGAEACGVSVKQFRRAIKNLETSGKLAIKVASKYSLATVVGWPFADDDESERASNGASKGPADAEKRATFKNIPLKNEKKEEILVAFATDTPPLDSAVEKKQPKTKTDRFIPPTPEEVDAYCRTQGFVNVEGIRFCNYYESIGWQVGKHDMKSWKAAARNWEHTGSSGGSGDGAGRFQSEAERLHRDPHAGAI